MKKIWERYIRRAAVVLLLLTLGSVSAFADNWYDDYVDHVLQKGYMECLTEDDFGAQDPMTREMFVSALYEMHLRINADEDVNSQIYEEAPGERSETETGAETQADSEVTETEATPVSELFDDVQGDESFVPALEWAVSRGIINGIDGNFCPDRCINREMMAVMIQRASFVLGMGYGGDWSYSIEYTDLESISPWAVDGIAYCGICGVMTGNSDGSFAPKRTLTRAEGAAVIVRVEENIVQQKAVTAK